MIVSYGSPNSNLALARTPRPLNGSHLMVGIAQIVKVLVDKKADVTYSVSLPERNLNCALNAQNMHFPRTRVFVRLCLCIFTIIPNDYVTQQNSRKTTPLHVACRRGHTQIAKILLDSKADPAACSKVTPNTTNASENLQYCDFPLNFLFINFSSRSPSVWHTFIRGSEEVVQNIHPTQARQFTQGFVISASNHLTNSID